MAATCRKLIEDDAEHFFHSIDTILFDCDGVVWDANKAIAGAPEAIRILEEMERIFSTSFAAAHYLKEKLKIDGKVYLIGAPGMEEEFQLYGIPYIGTGPDPVIGSQPDWLKISLDPEVKAVCVGFDLDFNYFKLLKAASYLYKPHVAFIATNDDKRFPSQGNIVLPGTGCIVNAVKTAARRDPCLLGKPNKYLFECIQQRNSGIDPARTLMVGDSLGTDIHMGRDCGLKTLLVQTGISTLEEARRNQASTSLQDQKLVPDFYLPSIKELGLLANKLQ